MKNKFVSFIMNIVLLIIIFVLVLFGIIIYQEIVENKNIQEVEDYASNYSNEKQQEEKVVKPDVNDDEKNNNNININTLDKIAKVPEQREEENKQSNTTTYKYFYNQLNKYSKIIYEGLDKNKEQMKTGTARIEFGDKFSELLELDNGTELLEKYYQSGIETYFADNPDVFYIKPSKLYLTKETITRRHKTTYNVYIDAGKNSNYLVDDFNSKIIVQEAINKIEEIKKNILSRKTGNRYYDIKMVHDYLVENTEYDRSISKENIYNIYGALVNKESVCEGYAKAFKYLLDELKIPCVVVNGKATNSDGKTENHAWNYVEINGKWYGIDVTWDDPLIIGNGKITNDIKYRYFLKGEEFLRRDHIPEGKFTEGGEIYKYPEISSNDFS